MKHAPLLLAALLSLSQCKDKYAYPKRIIPPLLPAETTTGLRTFGCLINGKPYTASGINRTNGDWPALNRLVVFASARNGEEEANINLLIIGEPVEKQTYPLQLSVNGPTTKGGLYANAFATGCYYDGKLIKQGSLTFTRYDPVARIAAGRFAFTLYQPGCDTLRVTDGRFDVMF